jgi:ribosomal protein L25 (general stress protein Ctc)
MLEKLGIKSFVLELEIWFGNETKYFVNDIDQIILWRKYLKMDFL